MRVAITGGRGFIGRHLANRLSSEGHELVLIARKQGEKQTTECASQVKVVTSDLSDTTILTDAFAGCDAVAHCAGINREIGKQTYERVHVEATRNVVAAAHATGVKKIVLMSFLRARAACGSPYHESKWAAEEIVRNSGLDNTIFKAGVVYGRGDHLLDHLARSIMTIRLFALVGWSDAPVRPVAAADVVRLFDAALAGGRLSRQTVAVLGPRPRASSYALPRLAH